MKVVFDISEELELDGQKIIKTKDYRIYVGDLKVGFTSCVDDRIDEYEFYRSLKDLCNTRVYGHSLYRNHYTNRKDINDKNFEEMEKEWVEYIKSHISDKIKTLQEYLEDLEEIE